MLLTFLILDGTSAGDGKTIGLCPSFYTNYRCVSTGHCNVCRLINGVAEGCEIRSTTPVCDMDESTSGIQDTASRKVAKCVACTKAGEISYRFDKINDQRFIKCRYIQISAYLCRWDDHW